MFKPARIDRCLPRSPDLQRAVDQGHLKIVKGTFGPIYVVAPDCPDAPAIRGALLRRRRVVGALFALQVALAFAALVAAAAWVGGDVLPLPH